MSVGIDPLLHAELIEQLMRVTDDETLLYAIVAAPSRPELLVALGAALPQLRMEFLAGSPVLAALGVASLDPQWRRSYPPRPQSLWAELEFLRALACTAPATNHLDELLAARDAAHGG